jgi:hypothetical protein
MQVAILGIGLLAPGLESWQAGRSVLAGRQVYEPGAAPEPEAALLPPNERRRSSDCVRWAVHVAQEAINQSGLDSRDVATVFASSGGEMGVLDRLCRTLALPERVVSPTLFHQSVHNTAAGYWGIATACQQSSTALSCYDDSFTAGLLDAITFVCVEEQPVLLVTFDLPAPHPLSEARPLIAGMAAALVMAPSSERGIAKLGGSLEERGPHRATTVDDAKLESLRVGNPAGRALPLLAAVAKGGQQTVRLELLEDQQLVLEIGPCQL